MRQYRLITANRSAKRDFAISETYLAGIALLGTEVKSIRAGQANLKGAFATINKGQLWLSNATVPPYRPSHSSAQHDPVRARKLLVHKRELKKMIAAKQNGLSIVPLSLGRQGGFLKVELGVGQGRKKYDKRETLKARSAKREAAKHLKRARK